MSLELVKEAVKINQVIGEEKTQTIIENDIIVPDIKPDIARILLIDGNTYINNTEALQDKVQVNGTVWYKILYISDDPEQQIKSINTNNAFHYTLDIPDTRHGMKCKSRCDIEHMEYEIINSRKVNIKTILSVGGKVVNQLEQNIVRDFEGVDRVQTLRSTTSINAYIGSSEMDCPIKEILEIPSGKPTIKEILRNDIKITGKDYKMTENRVVVKGDLNVSTLYIGDDENRSIQSMEHEIPFTQFIDLPGISEDSFCDIDYNIADSSFEADENNDGELRLLNGEVTLNIAVEAFGRKEIELIEDVYSPNSRINIEKEPFKMEELVTENKSQIVLKETIPINEESPDISEIFNVLCKPSVSDFNMADDRVVIEGVLESNLLYLANNTEQPVFCYGQETPFRQVIDIKGIKSGMDCVVDLDIENCSYSMQSSKEVEIRFVIGVSVRIINQMTVPVIIKANELPMDDIRLSSQPSITVYFVQHDDTLWKIAKKYFTTIEEIKKTNTINDNNTVNPGEQIIIPKR